MGNGEFIFWFYFSSRVIALAYGSLFHIEHLWNVGNLQTEINALQVEIDNLQVIKSTIEKSVIGKVSNPIPAELEVAMGQLNTADKIQNYRNWNSLFNQGIYNIYKNNVYYRPFINFSYNHFSNCVQSGLNEISVLENQIIERLKSGLWLNTGYNTALLEYESLMYFNKVRFIYSDFYINSMIRVRSHIDPQEEWYDHLINVIPKESQPFSFSPSVKNILNSGFYHNNVPITPFDFNAKTGIRLLDEDFNSNSEV